MFITSTRNGSTVRAARRRRSPFTGARGGASDMFDPWLLVAALIVEACVGYPSAVYRAIRHPVVWIGIAIDALERRWNRPEFGDGARRALGIVTVVLVVGGAAVSGYVVQTLASTVAF